MGATMVHDTQVGMPYEGSHRRSQESSHSRQNGSAEGLLMLPMPKISEITRPSRTSTTSLSRGPSKLLSSISGLFGRSKHRETLQSQASDATLDTKGSMSVRLWGLLGTAADGDARQTSGTDRMLNSHTLGPHSLLATPTHVNSRLASKISMDNPGAEGGHPTSETRDWSDVGGSRRMSLEAQARMRRSKEMPRRETGRSFLEQQLSAVRWVPSLLKAEKNILLTCVGIIA